MQFKTAQKVSLGFGTLTLLIVVLLFVIYFSVKSIVLKQTTDYLQGLLDAPTMTTRTSYEDAMAQQKINVDKLERLLEGKISLDESRKTPVVAENQVNQEKVNLELPTLLVDGVEGYKNNELINKFYSLTGTTVTLFQMIPEGMLRIATNIKKADGTLATGTFVPKESAVYKTIIDNKVYNGFAYVVNGDYITAYMPLKDKSGKIVGAIYTGVSAKAISSVKTTIKNKKIYEHGYYIIMDGKGKGLVHPTLEGKNLFEESADYKKAFELKNGSLDIESKEGRYIWEIRYIPEIDWFIIAVAAEKEVYAPITRMATIMLMIAIVVVGISTAFSLFLVRQISRPLTILEKDVSEIVLKVEEGDFRAKIDPDLLTNEFKPLAHGLNNLVTVVGGIISEICFVLEKYSAGDLTVKVAGEHKGDFERLTNSLNHAIASNHEIIDRVKNAVSEVKRGSQQIAMASTDLSQGATEQASSMEEVTSAMNEIGSQTKKNAEGANTAQDLSQKAMESATDGNKQMSRMLEAMKAIQASSESISKIIKVIDEIAFQTNLLALNAAVEAARAGKHGKGFAVVAEEVRNLAARSAQAAKETTELIGDSNNKAETGAKIADLMAQSLEKITVESSKVKDLVREIANASSEQAHGVGQVVVALNQIDQVTQRNTASAEESAAAAGSLSSQVSELDHLVEKYKI